MVSGRVIGVEFDGSPVFLFRRLPIPIVILRNNGERGMPFREIVVELCGPTSGIASFHFDRVDGNNVVATH